MKKIYILLAILILVSCLVACGMSNNDVNFFNDLIGETLNLYPYTLGLSHAEDGSYMRYKLNPSLPGFTALGEAAWEDALGALEYINQKLGFSPALYEKMTNTTEAMGVQTDSNSKFEVTWSYSSESGLNIIYERK